MGSKKPKTLKSVGGVKAQLKGLARYATEGNTATVAMRHRHKWKEGLLLGASGGFEDSGSDGAFRDTRERFRLVRAAQSDRALEGSEKHLAVVAAVQMLADLLADVARQLAVQVEREPPENLQALGLAVALMPMRV